jgi:hypothetical protein
MDRTEVTVVAFRSCVVAGKCKAKTTVESSSVGRRFSAHSQKAVD